MIEHYGVISPGLHYGVISPGLLSGCNELKINCGKEIVELYSTKKFLKVPLYPVGQSLKGRPNEIRNIKCFTAFPLYILM